MHYKRQLQLLVRVDPNVIKQALANQSWSKGCWPISCLLLQSPLARHRKQRPHNGAAKCGFALLRWSHRSKRFRDLTFRWRWQQEAKRERDGKGWNKQLEPASVKILTNKSYQLQYCPLDVFSIQRASHRSRSSDVWGHPWVSSCPRVEGIGIPNPWAVKLVWQCETTGSMVSCQSFSGPKRLL